VEAPRIIVVGSGNVATHLAVAFHKAGADIIQVCSRTLSNAAALASKVGAEAISELSEADASADFCIICVSDGAISGVVEALPRMSGIVLHTSGSVPVSVLYSASGRTGVMYPLQTFSKERELDMHAVPFFNEGSDRETLACIDRLASSVSGSVYHADSSSRQLLHIAGVLACNFPNYLLGCASSVLAQGGYKLDVIRPLVQETIDKAFSYGPDMSQTGPARRGDTSTIARHCAMLSPEKAEIYSLLSKAIMRKYSVNNEQD